MHAACVSMTSWGCGVIKPWEFSLPPSLRARKERTRFWLCLRFVPTTSYHFRLARLLSRCDRANPRAGLEHDPVLSILKKGVRFYRRSSALVPKWDRLKWDRIARFGQALVHPQLLHRFVFSGRAGFPYQGSLIATQLHDLVLNPIIDRRTLWPLPFPLEHGLLSSSAILIDP